MAKWSIRIGGKKIGMGQPVFVIAEAGVNHNGKLSLAKKLIDAAARAGADAVKFQTFSPGELVTKSAKKAGYQKADETGAGESQYAMLRRLALPREYYAKLKLSAEKKGIIFLSTPFSFSDATFLRRLGVKALKVSSSDANNFPYLRRIAMWGLPIILSTGMTDFAEVREAVRTIKKAGNKKLILLHCTTNYPAPFVEANIRAMGTLREKFGLPVGFSDHTQGSEVAIAAVALGARVIEKHLTLDRKMEGPDHKASLEPKEFSDFVRHLRNTEAALGSGKKVPFESENAIATVARKSVVTTAPVKKGQRFTKSSLGIKRPGTGLPPKYYDVVLGKRVLQNLKADTLVKKEHYER